MRSDNDKRICELVKNFIIFSFLLILKMYIYLFIIITATWSKMLGHVNE